MKYDSHNSMFVALPLLFALLIIYVPEIAIANPSSPPPPLFTETVDLVLPNFPINGLLLSLMYIVATLRGWRPWRMGVVRFIAVFGLSAGIITFSGALIDTVAFLEDDPVVYIAAAALIACIVVGVAYRYLRLPIRFSIAAGIVFFNINIAAWMFVNDWFFIVAQPSAMFIALWTGFVILLAVQSLVYHDRRWAHPVDARATGRQTATSSGDPLALLRIEWPMVEACVFSILLLAAVFLVSVHPIFRWPDWY